MSRTPPRRPRKLIRRADLVPDGTPAPGALIAMQAASRPLDRAALAQLPNGPGLYTIFRDNRPVYVGEAGALRARIGKHLLARTNVRDPLLSQYTFGVWSPPDAADEAARRRYETWLIGNYPQYFRHQTVYRRGPARESEWAGELVGADTRVRTIDTRPAPFRYVCNLTIGGVPYGSGTLIGPRTVLTAGHCLVVRGTTRFKDRTRIRVIPGRNGRAAPFGSAGVTAMILHPGFAPVSRTDLGILHLDRPLGTTVGFWRAGGGPTAVDPLGTSLSAQLPLATGTLMVNVAGYPGDKPADPGLWCRKPAAPRGTCGVNPPAPGRSVACGSLPFRAYDVTAAPHPSDPGLLRYMDDTCAGMSGGPVWVRRHSSMGGRVMVGVHVGDCGTANCAVRFTRAHLAFAAANTV